MRLTCFAPASRKSKCEPVVFRSNAEGSLQVDLSMRLAIVELVVGLIDRPPRRSTIAGPWMRSKGVDLGPTGRTRERTRGRVGAKPTKHCAIQLIDSVAIQM